MVGQQQPRMTVNHRWGFVALICAMVGYMPHSIQRMEQLQLPCLKRNSPIAHHREAAVHTSHLEAQTQMLLAGRYGVWSLWSLVQVFE